MKIKIIGKELKITEAINDYVERKLDRIDKYFEDAEADVTLRTEKNEQIAEICVIAGGEKYRAVTEDKDMYASIDKDIDILNVGIDVDDEAELNKTSKIVSGPCHPAFRQLVESAMWYDAIVEKIKKLNVKVKEVEVTVNPKDSDNVIGHKQENVQKLKELYDVDLVLNQDEKIKQGKSKIEITKTYED